MLYGCAWLRERHLKSSGMFGCDFDMVAICDMVTMCLKYGWAGMLYGCAWMRERQLKSGGMFVSWLECGCEQVDECCLPQQCKAVRWCCVWNVSK